MPRPQAALPARTAAKHRSRRKRQEAARAPRVPARRTAPATRTARPFVPRLRGDRSGAACQSRPPDARPLADRARACLFDRLVHLAFAPGKQAQLGDKALRKAIRFALYAARAAVDRETPPCIEPLPQDHRFTGEDWQRWPHNLIWQSFLLTQQWWYNATTGLRGIPRREQDVIEFMSRQLLDIMAPSNVPWLNPEILRATLDRAGTTS